MKKIFIILPLFLSGFLFSQKKPLKNPTKKVLLPNSTIMMNSEKFQMKL